MKIHEDEPLPPSITTATSMEPTSYCLFATSLGVCAIAWKNSDAGTDRPAVTFLQLPDASDTLTNDRIASNTGGQQASPPPAIAGIISRIQLHLSGKSQDFSDIPVNLGKASRFTQLVYKACREIPAGRTTSYGELARLLDKPRAARAVGQALAKNPIPLIIPCHRVVTADCQAGGFSAPGGVATKARILALEGVRCTWNGAGKEDLCA